MHGVQLAERVGFFQILRLGRGQPVHSVLLATFPLVRGFPFCAGGFHAFAEFLPE